MAGEDSLVEAADGLRDGFSVGVKVDAWDNVDGVMVIKSSKIIETSLVTDPAIDSARVANVAASEEEASQVSETTVPEVQPEGEQVSDTTVPETPAVTEAVEAHKVEAAAPRPAFYTSPRSPIVSAGTYLEHTIKGITRR
jgi:hypothetical protein